MALLQSQRSKLFRRSLTGKSSSALSTTSSTHTQPTSHQEQLCHHQHPISSTVSPHLTNVLSPLRPSISDDGGYVASSTGDADTGDGFWPWTINSGCDARIDEMCQRRARFT